jgi:hypothetical protein
LKSVIDGPADDAQRPDALLAMIAVEREDHPLKAEDLLAQLIASYPLHPAAELARKRGWVV